MNEDPVDGSSVICEQLFFNLLIFFFYCFVSGGQGALLNVVGRWRHVLGRFAIDACIDGTSLYLGY